MRTEIIIPDRLTPRPYQTQDIRRVAQGVHNSALIGHEMALGKTLIAVEALRERRSERNLIVAPLNTHQTWANTIRGQTGGAANVLTHPPGSSTTPEANLWWRAVQANTPAWYILGWNAFTGKATKEQADAHKNAVDEAKKHNRRKPHRKPNLPWWKTGHWDAVVLDECHRMANRTSMSYLTANTLDTEFKIAMSGTPARNKVEGFWAVMSWLWPHLYHDHVPGAQTYYRWVHKNLHVEKVSYGSGINIIGEKPGHRIADTIPLYLRRTTEEVLGDLPPVVTQTIEVPLLPGAQERAYRDLEERYFTWLEGMPLGTHLDAIKFLRLRQIACGVPRITYTGEYEEDGCEKLDVDFAPDCKSNKIDTVKDLLTDLPPDETALVFTHSARFARAVVHQINKAKLGPAALYTGEVDQNTRNTLRQMFGKGGIRVLVAGIAAIGEGTDGLQHVCRNEIWLSEYDDGVLNTQAQARLRRPGQKHTIRRWYIHSIGTADQHRHLTLADNAAAMRSAYAPPTGSEQNRSQQSHPCPRVKPKREETAMPLTRTIIFPEHADLMSQMSAHHGMGTDPAIHPFVADQLANRELEGRGVHMGLELAFAIYRERKGLGDIETTALWMSMPMWVKALVSEPEVQAEALASIRQVHGPA